MKTKTLLELLKKHGVHIYDNDEALISEVETEYKNQFSQLPASITDEEIKKVADSWFHEKWGEEKWEPKDAFINGMKSMRSLLNHPPVMGEGEKTVSGSMLLLELFQVAGIENEDGMKVIEHINKPNGGSVAYVRHDAMVNKLNSLNDANKLPPPHQANT